MPPEPPPWSASCSSAFRLAAAADESTLFDWSTSPPPPPLLPTPTGVGAVTGPALEREGEGGGVLVVLGFLADRLDATRAAALVRVLLERVQVGRRRRRIDLVRLVDVAAEPWPPLLPTPTGVLLLPPAEAQPHPSCPNACTASEAAVASWSDFASWPIAGSRHRRGSHNRRGPSGPGRRPAWPD